jgi:L-ascorbate metabolism protein UlaG (beta-lactamase superfamily)
MQIQWLGQACFKIQTKNSSSQEITIATDPFQEDCGLKISKFQADILTLSQTAGDNNNLEAIKGEPFIVSGPGEYETRDLFIFGVPTFHADKNGGYTTLYRLNAENINLVHLGPLGQELTDEQIDQIGDVDILLVPIGGGQVLDAKKASLIISEMEPRLVIPMYYQIPGLKNKLNTLEEFIKTSGLPVEKIEKLKIHKKDLPTEETKIIVLSP